MGLTKTGEYVNNALLPLTEQLRGKYGDQVARDAQSYLHSKAMLADTILKPEGREKFEEGTKVEEETLRQHYPSNPDLEREILSALAQITTFMSGS